MAATLRPARAGAASILLALTLAVSIVLGACGGGGDDDTSAKATTPASTPPASTSPAAAAIPGSAETAALLKGIPQSGMVLGDPKAPVTLLEYVDLQCPFCREHQLDVQPALIKALVRTGEARIAFVPLAFLGSDSVIARSVFLRMAQTDHAWEFANLFYWNQGKENSGYVTDAFLRKLVGAIPGTKPTDASRELDPGLETIAAQTDAMGQRVLGGHQSGTPGFTVGPSNANPLTYTWIDIYQEETVADQLIRAVRKARAKALKSQTPAPQGPTA